MLKRALALTLSLLLLCAAALGETTRYGEVFDAQGDAGRLTVRFLWLGPQVAEDKPGDAMILTSPDGKVMVPGRRASPGGGNMSPPALDALGVTALITWWPPTPTSTTSAASPRCCPAMRWAPFTPAP